MARFLLYSYNKENLNHTCRDNKEAVMYEKLGIRDRILVNFFGWVTGIRMLYPPEDLLTDEERTIKTVIPPVIEKESDDNNIHMMDGGASIH